MAGPRRFLYCLAFLLCLAAPAAAQNVVGSRWVYTVVKGDYLTRIGARFGIDPALLARENGLDYFALMHPGQRLRVDNRHIVPQERAAGMVINIPQRMLFFHRDGRVAAHFPVGLGRPDWPTPLGQYTVWHKARDKEWIVPPSIQAEMRALGQAVRERVPPGPDNPLGPYWLGLTPGGIGIHATIAPASIYHLQSHGCIRLHTDDAAMLYDQVDIGDSVEILYRTLLLAEGEDGRVYLEVHRDVYNRGMDPWLALLAEVQRTGLAGKLDWLRVAEVVARAEGIARPVGPPDPDERSAIP